MRIPVVYNKTPHSGYGSAARVLRHVSAPKRRVEYVLVSHWGGDFYNSRITGIPGVLGVRTFVPHRWTRP